MRFLLQFKENSNVLVLSKDIFILYFKKIKLKHPHYDDYVV